MAALKLGSQTERKIDLIFCIDGTGSMSPCIDRVKANARKFYLDFVDKMTNDYGSSVEELNVKIITFRDYEADGADAMTISEWFDLSAGDEAEYEKYLNSISAYGGGDTPENGLEALFYAMTADWNARGPKDRQVIVLFTDADALPFRAKKSKNYPTNMVDEEGLLNTWMCIKPRFVSQSDFKLSERCKRLVMFAPPGTVYEKMQQSYNRSQFVPTMMDAGLGEMEFDEIIKIIAASASSV
ncbi:MAG: vWA domain-containing protein [Christensenellales bacterium]|jgi:hypothetical protein|nr:VWA domain-containing protein [Clostridiales bacterium]